MFCITHTLHWSENVCANLNAFYEGSFTLNDSENETFYLAKLFCTSFVHVTGMSFLGGLSLHLNHLIA